MAKNEAAKAPEGTGSTTSFKIETGIPVPPRTRFGGGSETNYPFKDMAVGASFLMPVNVPDTIKDDKERDRAFKEEARKLSNRISGAIRRFRKSNDGYNFAIRTVNDDKQGRGVRVWRVEAGE